MSPQQQQMISRQVALTNLTRDLNRAEQESARLFIRFHTEAKPARAAIAYDGYVAARRSADVLIAQIYDFQRSDD
jgi:hypothetical protein